METAGSDELESSAIGVGNAVEVARTTGVLVTRVTATALAAVLRSEAVAKILSGDSLKLKTEGMMTWLLMNTVWLMTGSSRAVDKDTISGRPVDANPAGSDESGEIVCSIVDSVADTTD